MSRLGTLDLAGLPGRTALMWFTACAALAIDFVSKSLTVALRPDTLLFNVSELAPYGLGAGPLIFLAAASSLLACVLPFHLVAAGAGVALGGAAGNLLSRRWWSAYGGSPDFIHFRGEGTGNVADLFIVGGIVVMLVGAVGWLVLALLQARRRPD